MSGLGTFLNQFWGIAFVFLFVMFLIVNVGFVKYYVRSVLSAIEDLKQKTEKVNDQVVKNQMKITEIETIVKNL